MRQALGCSVATVARQLTESQTVIPATWANQVELMCLVAAEAERQFVVDEVNRWMAQITQGGIITKDRFMQQWAVFQGMCGDIRNRQVGPLLDQYLRSPTHTQPSEFIVTPCAAAESTSSSSATSADRMMREQHRSDAIYISSSEYEGPGDDENDLYL